jgi:putative hydrolase of the HAD superfamily
MLTEYSTAYGSTSQPAIAQRHSMQSHVPKITLPEDTRDVLNRLSGKYTLALLTDGFLPAQQLKVQALGLEKYFKCIIYTEQLGRKFWKPSPAGFEKLMETLNATPETVAYVADNEQKDFIAPNKLGFFTIQIIRPARIHTESSEQPGAAAKHIIHKISQVPPLLEKL